MSGENGFTYPAALLMIIVISASLMVVQKQWSTIVKREKEQELFFRAGQIVAAIDSYYKSSPGSTGQYPESLNVLLKDNRFPVTRRHLRKIFSDPMTKQGKWGFVYDGRGRIKGVFSQSRDRPMKTGNFPPEYESFDGSRQYSDWKFVHDPKKESSP